LELFLKVPPALGLPWQFPLQCSWDWVFNPLYAAVFCLIANTAPVAFGSVGTPIIMASRVSDIPEMAISQMVGRTLPFLSVVVPFYLVVLMSGFKRSMEVLPAIVVSGVSFAFFQWFAQTTSDQCFRMC
jgi:lactate permease